MMVNGAEMAGESKVNALTFPTGMCIGGNPVGQFMNLQLDSSSPEWSFLYP